MDFVREIRLPLYGENVIYIFMKQQTKIMLLCINAVFIGTSQRQGDTGMIPLFYFKLLY
jgi:hypothetical protein